MCVGILGKQHLAVAHHVLVRHWYVRYQWRTKTWCATAKCCPKFPHTPRLTSGAPLPDHDFFCSFLLVFLLIFLLFFSFLLVSAQPPTKLGLTTRERRAMRSSPSVPRTSRRPWRRCIEQGLRRREAPRWSERHGGEGETGGSGDGHLRSDGGLANGGWV